VDVKVELTVVDMRDIMPGTKGPAEAALTIVNKMKNDFEIGSISDELGLTAKSTSYPVWMWNHP